MVIDKLFIAFFSLLPAIIYALTVYVIMPYKSINLWDGFRFLIAGMFSIIILKYLYSLGFDSMAGFQWVSGITDTKDIFYLHYYYFISVAFFEELSKFLAFILFLKLINIINKKDIHPISIMFYCGMVGLGFAVSENIEYAEGSPSPFITLWWRSAAPVLTHMMCGFFMGYWLGLNKIGPKMNNRSLFDIIIQKRKMLSQFIYVGVGIFCATILHGVYNLHLELNGIGGLSGAYILIILSSLGVLFCFHNIYSLYKSKIIETNAKKEPEEESGEIEKTFQILEETNQDTD